MGKKVQYWILSLSLLKKLQKRSPPTKVSNQTLKGKLESFLNIAVHRSFLLYFFRGDLLENLTNGSNSALETSNPKSTGGICQCLYDEIAAMPATISN
jgi:hypothetical protein